MEEALAADPGEPRPPLVGETAADVVILGGGYTGMWTAFFLKERDPGIDVVLLEQDICGGGPSGRNGGFLDGWCPARRRPGRGLERAPGGRVGGHARCRAAPGSRGRVRGPERRAGARALRLAAVRRRHAHPRRRHRAARPPGPRAAARAAGEGRPDLRADHGHPVRVRGARRGRVTGRPRARGGGGDRPRRVGHLVEGLPPVPHGARKLHGHHRAGPGEARGDQLDRR
ncbi:MAG: FAD-dependent oxidoreductase [Actinobacteria bacterium]|nr:FAD-dependent oxidoreductase [Actinomycetota bacterium]